MKPASLVRIPVVVLSLCAGLAASAWAGECEDLRGETFGKAQVRAAIQVPAGAFAPPGGPALTSLPDFCRVVLTAKPSRQSNVTIEVWLPSSTWNGKLLGAGNGGFAGTISYPPLASGIRRGYATANTDLGTFPAGLFPDYSYEAGIGHPEMVRDWGHRATHAMTLAARAVISRYYGRKPDRAYFMGCSTGGHQGLMEAQRYPDDYDGIIAGAPGHNRTHLHASFARFFQMMSAAPALFATANNAGATFSSSKLTMVREALLARCGRGQDGGAAGDPFLNNPAACDFEPSSLQCAQGQATSSCLTAAEVSSLKEVYGGARNSRTREVVYPGWPFGSELALLANGGRRAGDETTGRADGLLRWVLGAKWDARTLTLDRDIERVDREIGRHVNALDAGLSGFQERGGRLILFHGWDDPIVSAHDSILYWQRVREANPGTHAAFIRLFMAPGVSHCQGGSGPDVFGAGNGSTDPADPERDILTALEQWVEAGRAPDQLIAGKRGAGGDFIMTRPLCGYPGQARYSGAGDAGDARSFACAPGPEARFESPAAAYLGANR